MTILLSCFSNSFRPHSTEEAIVGVRAAGLEYIELGLRTTGSQGEFVEPPDERTLAGWEKLLDEQQLKVSSVCIISGDPLDPQRLAVCMEKLKAGKRLGARLAVTLAGEAADDGTRARLYEHHRRLGDLAGALGLVVGFETHPGLCEDWRGMLRTMQDLDHPALRLNFDTANYLFYNADAAVEVALQRVSPWLAGLHLKDSRGEYRERYFPALGDGGAIDFCRTLEILNALRFRGPATIEIDGIAGAPPPTLSECQTRLERSVRHLRKCGWFDPRLE